MERKEYLERCQRCATLPKGAYSLGKDIPDDIKVVCGESEYSPWAYMLTFDVNGNAIHTAMVHDINTNLVLFKELSEIKAKED